MIAYEYALVISAARGAFLRLREDLRQVEETFAKDLALSVLDPDRPLADSQYSRNTRVETIVTRAFSVRTPFLSLLTRLQKNWKNAVTYTGIQQRKIDGSDLSRASLVMTGVMTESSLSARKTISSGFLYDKYVGRLKGVSSPCKEEYQKLVITSSST